MEITEEKMQEFTTAVKTVQDTMADVDTKVKGFDAQLETLNGLDKEKIEKAMEAIDKIDEMSQKEFLEASALENETKALNERIGNLEGQLVRVSKKDSENYKESAEYKAFNQLMMKGTDALEDEHKEILAALDKGQEKENKYLRTDVNENGGVLVPELLASDMARKVQEISPVRALARIRTIKAKTLQIPIRDTIPTATYEGEAEENDDSNSTYESQTMVAHRQHATVPITRDLLNYAGFDMESEITRDAVTAFAKGEGNKFIVGTGVKQPEGILTRVGTGNNDIEAITSASSGVITLDEVIELAGELKEGYNPVYAFNRKTLYSLRTEKDSNGNYLWRIGGETMPKEINGFKYVIMQDMADIASNSLSVLFGDFFNGYNILDSIEMELVRDIYTQKKKAIVEFSWNRYNDGRVVLGEAFKVLQTKA